MSINLDEVTAALQSTKVSLNGISFAKQSLKLDSAKDAIPIVNAIEKCKELEYLDLEGNTLGVDAAKEIAKALEAHPEFRKALWKDLFTGRMKTEIPKALEYLGNGLVNSGARLTELDLSDNAFGPIGVQGLATLVRSSACCGLEELKLNNNGLGITGGKLLASALIDCYNKSKTGGRPLALKVFIAGRNRLENEGAKALAEVFKAIGTLEEIEMPQNGIYFPGIQALSDAFTKNPNLKIINLNDNTIGKKGGKALADALRNLQHIVELNLGDCLLKTEGAKVIAESIKNSAPNLEILKLGFNEIGRQGVEELIEALSNKSKLKILELNGNQFGADGRIAIENGLKNMGKLNVLDGLDEDESGSENEESGSEEDGNESDNAFSEEECSQDEKEEKNISNMNNTGNDSVVFLDSEKEHITVQEFVSAPSAYNFINLGEDRIEKILSEFKKDGKYDIESFVPVIMKISSLTTNNKVTKEATKCTEILYKELFSFIKTDEQNSLANNSILINLGVLKSEDKSFKPTWNLEGCFKSLVDVTKKEILPENTKMSIKVFMEKEIANDGEFISIKKEILNVIS